MRVSVKVENLGKIFRVYHDRRFKEALVSIFKGRRIYENLVALKDISLEVGRGECLGIIGANGSGKSTLLKLLAGILYPDEGKIAVDGRISTLIDLESGLHLDLTGLENIYLNASLFGLTRKEIKERLSDIIEFSELSNFIDTQTRYYSDGMRARLGFSIAIHVDADVLLIDEVLAVGDLSFKEKCYAMILEFKKSGRSIVYVSHDFESIKKVCDKVVWLDKGANRYTGNPEDAVHKYAAM